MSEKIRMPLSISLLQLRKWIKKPEVYLVFLCLAIFVSSRVMNIRMMIEAVGVDAAPYLFPFLFSDMYMAFFILAGSIILFAEAPFWSTDQSEVLIRTGRLPWLAGQIIYMVMASVIYMAGVLVISIAALLPYVQMSKGWGSIWNTIAQTDAAIMFDMNMSVPYYIISRYEPLQVVGIQYILGVAVSVFIGLVLFLLDMHFGKKAGIAAASLLALFTIRIDSFPDWVHWLFPTVWSNLNIMRQEAEGMGPTVYEGAIGIFAVNVLIICIIIKTGRRKDLV
jgi:hypothetical protein